jgi:hypothetical protein
MSDAAREIAITLLRDLVLRRSSMADIESTIAKMIDEAIANPNTSFAQDLRKLGILPPRG